MSSLEDVTLIPQEHTHKLIGLGVFSTEQLLRSGSNPIGRRELVRKTGIRGRHVLRWLHFADLLRVPSMAEPDAELLLMADVPTVVELSQLDPDRLFLSLQDVLRRSGSRLAPPLLHQVRTWIEEANHLPPILQY